MVDGSANQVRPAAAPALSLASRLFVVFAAIWILGCQQEPIQHYRVSKLKPTVETKAEPARMVTAIVERPDATWFFKLTGSPGAIEANQPGWNEFLRSVQFNEQAKPEWTLPADWKASSAASAMRFATLIIGQNQPPLEVSVSQLPPGQDLFSNINRWRGQLGLPPITEDQLEANVTRLTTEKCAFVIFDASGVSSGSSPPMAPMQPPMASQAASDQAVPQAASDKIETLKFDPPAGWESMPTAVFSTARFSKTVGTDTANIGVIRLVAASQNWQQNVNIWTGELELSPLSDDEIAAQTITIKIDGHDARRIDLTSPDGKRKTSIVNFDVGADAWFVKLSGDAAVVEAEQEAWEKFLQSIHINPARE